MPRVANDDETPETPVEDKPMGMTLRGFIQGMYDSGVPVSKVMEEVTECMLSIYGTTVVSASPYTQAWGVEEHSPDDDDRALWTGTCGVDSVPGVIHSCDNALATASNDAYDTHDEEEPSESEPEDDETEDDEPEEDEVIDTCDEFENVVRINGSRFEGQPVRKIVFTHFRLSPDELRSTAEWKDTPCPMTLKIEAVHTLADGAVLFRNWKAESVFNGRTYRVTTDTLGKLIAEYNETYRHLVK